LFSKIEGGNALSSCLLDLLAVNARAMEVNARRRDLSHPLPRPSPDGQLHARNVPVPCRYKGLKETELNDKLVKVTGKLGKFKNINKKAMDQFNQFTDQVPQPPCLCPRVRSCCGDCGWARTSEPRR
jgi:hypothetical protein